MAGVCPAMGMVRSEWQGRSAMATQIHRCLQKPMVVRGTIQIVRGYGLRGADRSNGGAGGECGYGSLPNRWFLRERPGESAAAVFVVTRRNATWQADGKRQSAAFSTKGRRWRVGGKEPDRVKPDVVAMAGKKGFGKKETAKKKDAPKRETGKLERGETDKNKKQLSVAIPDPAAVAMAASTDRTEGRRGGGEQGKGVADAPSINAARSSAINDGRDGDDDGDANTEDVFEKKLQAIRSSVPVRLRQQKEAVLGPIDYDRPVTATDGRIETVSVEGEINGGGRNKNLLVKVAGGVAAIVFAVIFIASDFDFGPRKSNTPVEQNEMTAEEKATLETRLRGFEDALKQSPDDTSALEGAAVTYADLGEYVKASKYLEQLIKKRPGDVEAIRLLAETRAASGQFGTSAAAYREAIRASSTESITLLRGLSNVLITDGKPGDAVGELLAARLRLTSAKNVATSPSDADVINAPKGEEDEEDAADLVQINLLLGKAYAAWGKVVDAAAVYDGLIKSRPDDFRGYLGKGLFLKEQGQVGDAERMFLQARFLAPDKAKTLVDRLSGR